MGSLFRFSYSSESDFPTKICSIKYSLPCSGLRAHGGQLSDEQVATRNPAQGIRLKNANYTIAAWSKSIASCSMAEIFITCSASPSRMLLTSVSDIGNSAAASE